MLASFGTPLVKMLSVKIAGLSSSTVSVFLCLSFLSDCFSQRGGARKRRGNRTWYNYTTVVWTDTRMILQAF